MSVSSLVTMVRPSVVRGGMDRWDGRGLMQGSSTQSYNARNPTRASVLPGRTAVTRRIFCDPVVAILCAVACWGSSLRVADTNRPNWSARPVMLWGLALWQWWREECGPALIMTPTHFMTGHPGASSDRLVPPKMHHRFPQKVILQPVFARNVGALWTPAISSPGWRKY